MLVCLIGFTLFFASIYMSYLKQDNEIFNNFNKLLNEKQKIIYQKIIRERISIYISGSVLGLLTGIFYLYRYKNENYKICKFLTIIYVIQLGFYKIYPKSPLFLYSLTTKSQTDAWADIYTEMKSRWIQSIFMGLIGYILIGNYLCEKCK